MQGLMLPIFATITVMLSLLFDEFIQVAAWSLLSTAAALTVDMATALGLANMVCIRIPDWFAKASLTCCNRTFYSS